MKPNGYPLPWCDALDVPYYKINLALCLQLKGWKEKQRHRPMSEIIPWIDELIVGKLIENSS